jgi:septal ring factor EnvC (AmiA/AmiB activator)
LTSPAAAPARPAARGHALTRPAETDKVRQRFDRRMPGSGPHRDHRMNKFLQNLLLVFAMALCCLATFQWVREGHLRKDIAGLHGEIYTNLVNLQALRYSAQQDAQTISRLENQKIQLNGVISTNETKIKELDKLVDKLSRESIGQKETIENYKQTVITANERLKQQNEAIEKQNGIIRDVAKQRDDKVEELKGVVEKYNKLVADYNKLAEEAQKLADQFQAQQQGEKKK